MKNDFDKMVLLAADEVARQWDEGVEIEAAAVGCDG